VLAGPGLLRSGHGLARVLSGCRWRVGLYAYFGEGPYRGQAPHPPRQVQSAHPHQPDVRGARQGRGEPARRSSALEFAPVAPLPPRRRFQPAAQDSANVERLLAQGRGPSRRPRRPAQFEQRRPRGRPAAQMGDERYVELAKLILVEIPEAFILLTGSKAGGDCRREAGSGPWGRLAAVRRRGTTAARAARASQRPRAAVFGHRTDTRRPTAASSFSAAVAPACSLSEG